MPNNKVTPIVERFWRKVNKTESCWLWTGAKTFGGYGVISSAPPKPYKPIRAHRLSYEIHKGEIPEGHDVLHTCDAPTCVNPEHLFTGTPKDNYADCLAKGRNYTTDERRQRGEKHHGSKLDESTVLAIRAEYAAGASMRKLAPKYDVDRKTIAMIVKRITWVHI